MAGTTIKGVGSNTGANLPLPNVGNTAAQNANTSFQTVWNAKTGGNNAANAKTAQSGTDHNKVNRGESLKARDTRKVDLKENTAQDANDDTVDVEKAQEVLASALQTLIDQITETFGVSEEELQGIMDDMNLTQADLLNAGSLNALLMNLGGAEDSFALLTNEELYGDVKEIMDLQKQLIGEIEDALHLKDGQLTEILSQNAGNTEPVITVEREDEPVQTQATGTEAVAAQATDETTKVQNTQENKADDAGAKSGDSGKGGEHTGNLLLQNLKEGNFLQQLEQTTQTGETTQTDTQDIMRQIMDYMKVSVKADSSDLEMQLHPQSLGTIHIQMAAKNGVVTANFITQNETVKAALESQMIQLKENFEAQGVKVEAIEVTVQTHQFEENLDQNRGRETESSEAGGVRKRTRRINLNAMQAEEEPQTEEERIAADLMSANGNTVDFTA